MKKRKGSFLITIGLLLLAAAFGLTGYNIYESNRAEKSSDYAVQEIKTVIDKVAGENTEEIPDYIKFPQKEMPTVEIDGRRYVGIVEFPTLGLSLPVMAGEWDYDKLEIAPCCYSGSIYENNMVIAAHNYRSHFARINKLDIGSEVYFTDVEGNIFSYVVGWVDILQSTDVEEMKTGADWDLTLFTCTYGGRTRYTVRCVLQE